MDETESTPIPPKRRRDQHRRNQEGDLSKKLADSSLSNDNPTMQFFKSVSIALDEKHDRYERLVKLSRDVTIESKRVIFLLHRLNDSEQDASVLDEAESRLKSLQEGKLKDMAKELSGQDFYQYHRPVSFGQQEYIEALTFFHYVKYGKIASYKVSQDTMSYSSDAEDHMVTDGAHLQLTLTQTDYLLGIADLTGELMRKSVSCVSRGKIEQCFEICSLMQTILNGFLSLGNLGPREIGKKMTTMRQSVAKVENACYALRVRGSEIPQEMLKDLFSSGMDEGELR